MKSLHYVAIFIRLFALGLVVLSLREATLFLIQLISDRTYQQGVADIIAESRAGIIATLFEITFSLGLVLWSKSVSKLITRVAR